MLLADVLFNVLLANVLLNVLLANVLLANVLSANVLFFTSDIFRSPHSLFEEPFDIHEGGDERTHLDESERRTGDDEGLE